MLAKLFFSGFLTWTPLVFSGLILLIVALNHFFSKKSCFNFLQKLTSSRLIYILIGATLLFDLLLSGLQYMVWQNAAFSRLFLPPYQSITYFLHYSAFHFFAANILVLVFASAFYLVLRLIRKYRADIITKEELNLVFLISLLVSWPHVVLLVPLFLLLAIIFSVFNLLVFKKNQTGLALPIILSSIIIFLFGTYLINFLSLSVLII